MFLRFTAKTSEIQEVENLTSTVRRESSNDSENLLLRFYIFYLAANLYRRPCVNNGHDDFSRICFS